jgi:hypothetical protein
VGYIDWWLGCLTSHRLEKRGLSSQDFNPQSIWGSSYHTTATKAQQLHHLTKKFVEPSCDEAEADRTVCITYGGWTDRAGMHEAASWFVRYSQREPVELVEEMKPNTAPPATADSANKKRKIRRQMDVGSMLGTFT